MPQPFTRIIALDFETAWSSKSYTLKKLTNEEYVRDKRFKAWGCAYQYLDDLDGKPQWISHDDLPRFFASVDWSTTAALAHNAQFDLSILAWHYGHIPCFIFDTLSLGRALRGVEVGNSLKVLAEEFGLPAKGKAVYSTDGILDSLPPEVEAELGPYCEHDVALCIAIFDQFVKDFPTKELRLIDTTLRMYVNTVLQLDKQMLVDAIKDEKEKREALLTRLGVSDDMLASNDKFAEVLRTLGIDPPMKASRTTGKPAFAFAKTDTAFQALVNHDREEVALLCEARMAVKSTLERTRAQRFLDVANRGKLPVPLNYYAAHTGRWGGSKGSGINMQNLKRGSFLRRAIHAPAGYVLMVADLDQIEPRVLAWLANDANMLQVFASGKDPYSVFGATMFGIPELSKQTHPDLRQSAKSALLGCGYGMGWVSFAAQLMSGFMGAPPVLYGISFAKQLGLHAYHVEYWMSQEEFVEKLHTIPRICSNDELALHCVITKRIIDLYRKNAHAVTDFWALNTSFLSKCLSGDGSIAKFGGGKTVKHKCLTYTQGQIILPNGLALRYPDIQSNPGENGRVQWTYGIKTRKKLYGGKLTENIVQAVARIVMTDGMLRCQKRYPCVLTAHDEIVLLVPEQEAEHAEEWVRQQMVKEPTYMPGIPLSVSVAYAKRYGDAK